MISYVNNFKVCTCVFVFVCRMSFSNKPAFGVQHAVGCELSRLRRAK